MVHPNFKNWFSRNPEISVEADMILFGMYWIMFFYGLLLSCSIYYYTFKRTNLQSTFISKIGLLILLGSILYALRALILQGNIYIPLFPIVFIWGFWVMVFAHPEGHPEFPKFPSKTVDNNICMDSQTFYGYYGPYGPFGYPYQLKDTGGEKGKIFNHRSLTLWYKIIKDLISLKRIFGKHTFNAMTAFQEFNAGADCPQNNETCRELNLLLQAMMKEYAPYPVESSQISIAEMNTPPINGPAVDQDGEPLDPSAPKPEPALSTDKQSADPTQPENSQNMATNPDNEQDIPQNPDNEQDISQNPDTIPEPATKTTPAEGGSVSLNRDALSLMSNEDLRKELEKRNKSILQDNYNRSYHVNEPIGSVPGTLHRQY